MDDKGNVVPKPLPIQLWNVTDRKATMIIPTGEVYLSFLQFGPGGSTLIGRFFNGKVYIWDTATGEEKLHFQPPMHQPTNFYTAISANGKFMATGDQDSNVVRFWDMQTGKQLAEFAGSPGIVSSLAFAPDSNLVAVGASNTTVLLVDVRKVLAKK
jgi:WD40 repeat protein